MSKTILIGCAGQAQNGKDTLCDKLHEELQKCRLTCKRIAFASNVKKVFTTTFGVDLEFVEKWKVIDEHPPGFTMSVRKSLQFIGDGFRKIQPMVWLDFVFREKISQIISDVRYVNEFKRVKIEGGINILVVKPDRINNDQNGSEAEIRPYVDWCLSRFYEKQKVVDLRSIFDSDDIPIDAPPYMDCFDLFIRNDGTVEDLHKIVESEITPYVINYWRNNDESK